MGDLDRFAIGIGYTTGCPYEDLAGLVSRTLLDLALDVSRVAVIATRAEKRNPVLAGQLADFYGADLILFTIDELAGVTVRRGSVRVMKELGTASVAEAAACRAAGSGGMLLVGKCRSAYATCAIARIG